MEQGLTNARSLPQNTGEGSNNIIQQSNIKKRGWKFFFIRLFYMLALSIGIVYTMSRFGGQGILDSLQNTMFIFTLPVLFIIGFALAMWKFWYSVPWFILATVGANSLIFRGIKNGLSWLTAIEVPIFLGVTLFVFAFERGFSAIPQKWLKWVLSILPFVIMLFIIFLTYLR